MAMDCIRPTTKGRWYGPDGFKRVYQRLGEFLPGDASLIGTRGKLAIEIYDKAVDGRVAINIDQMDCDCCRWTSSFVTPALPFAIERRLNDIYSDAEGPIYGLWFSAPEDKAHYKSRDLAMEAFEDGHPHSISAADVYWESGGDGNPYGDHAMDDGD